LSNTSSKLEIQLDFLAKELELERVHRKKLQGQVAKLAQIIEESQQKSQEEFDGIQIEKFLRET
jgi:hypothetical protein